MAIAETPKEAESVPCVAETPMAAARVALPEAHRPSQRWSAGRGHTQDGCHLQPTQWGPAGGDPHIPWETLDPSQDSKGNEEPREGVCASDFLRKQAHARAEAGEPW